MLTRHELLQLISQSNSTASAQPGEEARVVEQVAAQINWATKYYNLQPSWHEVRRNGAITD
jgi:hypothetical protein